MTIVGKWSLHMDGILRNAMTMLGGPSEDDILMREEVNFS